MPGQTVDMVTRHLGAVHDLPGKHDSIYARVLGVAKDLVVTDPNLAAGAHDGRIHRDEGASSAGRQREGVSFNGNVKALAAELETNGSDDQIVRKTPLKSQNWIGEREAGCGAKHFIVLNGQVNDKCFSPLLSDGRADTDIDVIEEAIVNLGVPNEAGEANAQG